ncbi:MAG: hypoxanthine phosphoribosyltransferase, partial [Bacteroidaceae bacterium]|nr:hypoxanthine phosphoribosyltransferase [Bacteroidaceae bacterium]
MDTIQVSDRKFSKFIAEEEILKQVKRVAQEINRDYAGKNPLFLCVLNGSFMFASDLLKEITIPCNISFVKVASYQGTIS